MCLCLSRPLSGLVSGPDVSILIPTCYQQFESPLSDEIWMCASSCLTPPSSLKASLMPIYWRPQELSVRRVPSAPVFSCFINSVYFCVMKYECMSFLFSVPFFFFFFSPLTSCFSQVSLSDEIWMLVPLFLSLHHLLSVSAVHRCGMKYRCLSPLAAVNAKCYLSITGEIMSVLSKHRGLYMLFWLMKCCSHKYT